MIEREQAAARLPLSLGIVLTTLCMMFPQGTLADPTPPPNILLLIADDYGVDASPLYTAGPNVQATPTISALAAQGVVFDSTWANATCSTTRGTIVSGQHGFRTGLTIAVAVPGTAATAIEGGAGYGLNLDEVEELAGVMSSAGYSTALIGKSHIRTSPDAAAEAYTPQEMGFDYFAGFIGGGPRYDLTPPPASNQLLNRGESYYDWYKSITDVDNPGNDTINVVQSKYVTTDNVDEAIAWIGSEVTAGNPWFMQLAFAAPHPPFELPPASLLTATQISDFEALVMAESGVVLREGTEGYEEVVYDVGSPYTYMDGDTVERGSNSAVLTRAVYNLTISVLDTELARLIASLDAPTLANTYIIFVGDNGTPGAVAVAPYNPQHGKLTLFQEGVHVPLIVSGPGVANGVRSGAMVHTVDLYPTVLEMAGLDPATAVPIDYPLDGFSIVAEAAAPSSDFDSVRSANYSEQNFYGDTWRNIPCTIGVGSLNFARGEVVSDGRYKLKHNDAPVCYQYAATIAGDFDPNRQYQRGSFELYDLQNDPLETFNLIDQPDRSAADLEIYERLCNDLTDIRIDDPNFVLSCDEPLPPLPPGC